MEEIIVKDSSQTLALKLTSGVKLHENNNCQMQQESSICFHNKVCIIFRHEYSYCSYMANNTTRYAANLNSKLQRLTLRVWYAVAILPASKRGLQSQVPNPCSVFFRGVIRKVSRAVVLHMLNSACGQDWWLSCVAVCAWKPRPPPPPTSKGQGSYSLQ